MTSDPEEVSHAKAAQRDSERREAAKLQQFVPKPKPRESDIAWRYSTWMQ